MLIRGGYAHSPSAVFGSEGRPSGAGFRVVGLGGASTEAGRPISPPFSTYITGGHRKERLVRFGTLISRLRRAAVPGFAMLLGVASLTGCETQSLGDPGEMLRTSKERLLVPVLPSLAEGLDEMDAEYPNARDVRQADLKSDGSDYVIGRNDLLSISISEVAGQGVETVKTTRVSESGMVSLPLIGTVKASGQTEAELEKLIAQTYKDKNIIQSAQVAVTVIEARQRTFSILGIVGRPGQYQIVQSDFKLLDAITLAGDVQVQGIDHIYVIRKLGGNPDRPAGKPAGVTPTPPAPGDTAPKKPADPLEGKQGRLMKGAPKAPVMLALLADAKEEGGERKVMIDGKWVPVKGTEPVKAADPVAPAAPAKPATPAVADPLAPKVDTIPAAGTGAAAPDAGKKFEFDEPKADADTEVIRVPYGKIYNGELQYNIVIKPNDTIVVRSPKVGEYYMGGHVNRPGVYSLTGRDITLKQAIISAGMLDALAWPDRTEVIRRVGKDKELFVRVNLPKIFAGEQSDIFLRPYDVVNVGTNAIAPFLASLRGAFRFTYGFGFIYDRNYNTSNQNSN